MFSKSEADAVATASEVLARLATASRMQGTDASASIADAYGLGAFHSSCLLAAGALAAVLSDAAAYLDDDRARDALAAR
jgi:hypothetical protein